MRLVVLCSNCRERLASGEAHCFADWCQHCNDALRATRVTAEANQPHPEPQLQQPARIDAAPGSPMLVAVPSPQVPSDYAAIPVR